MDEDLEEFEIVSSINTIEPELAFEGTNASRFAIIATFGGENPILRDNPVDEVEPADAERYGINPDLIRRAAELNPAENEYAGAVVLINRYRDDWSAPEVRFNAWRDLNRNGDLNARLALLVAGTCSPLERESVAAAVAIVNSVSSAFTPASSPFWRQWPFWLDEPWFDPLLLGGPWPWLMSPPDEDGKPDAVSEWSGLDWDRYSNSWVRQALRIGDPADVLTAVRALARLRVDLGRRSGDPIVRQLAAAAFLFRLDGAVAPPVVERTTSTTGVDTMSTMVHGTWGWKGDWWYPGGEFHRFIRDPYRPRLYGDGQEFSWSGAYKSRDRAVGGARFKRWADAQGGAAGLGSVFAHSYGGEVAARAVNDGALIDEVVLLSAPIHEHHLHMLSRVRRVVDVRLRDDIVLRLARAAQKLPDRDNVIKHIIKRSFWSHGASHKPEVWRDERIASIVGL